MGTQAAHPLAAVSLQLHLDRGRFRQPGASVPCAQFLRGRSIRKCAVFPPAVGAFDNTTCAPREPLTMHVARCAMLITCGGARGDEEEDPDDDFKPRSEEH